MSTAVRLVALVLVSALALAACGGGQQASPSASEGCGASATACPTPSTKAGGSEVPAGFSCPVARTMLVAPSNRLTGVTVTARTGYDEVVFTFGEGAPGSGAVPGAIIDAAEPPFVQGASGLPLAVEGERFVELVFRDMVVADESGAPAYAGAQSIRPVTPAVSEVVQAEAFEGVVRWLIGMREPGCVRITGDPAGGRILVDVAVP